MDKIIEPSHITTEDTLHTEELQDLITVPPKWIIRCGIVVFCFIIIVVIFFSFLISVPQVTKTRVLIVSGNHISPISAPANGKIGLIMTYEKQLVPKGKVLFCLESDIDYKYVEMLLKNMLKIRENIFSDCPLVVSGFNFVDQNRLGELLPYLQEFQLAFLQNLHNLQYKKIDRLAIFLHQLNQCIERLQKWQNMHVVYANRSGIVRFLKECAVGENVKDGEPVIYIYAKGDSITGKVITPITDFYQINKVQKIKLNLISYLDQDFKQINGTVLLKRNITEQPAFNVLVKFDVSSDILNDHYCFAPGLTVDAEITLVKVRLFDKITSGLFKQIKQ